MPHRISVPALIVAAPASGQGKTTVTAALARMHSRAGRSVRVFKCGPDFLDPMWHRLASKAPVYQLDLWMTGEAHCREILYQAALEADLLLIEGVMGLFDGTPSAADLSCLFCIPVLGVIDASAMAGTFGAIVHGLQTFRAGLPWAGVLANRVAGQSHANMLADSLKSGPGWLGSLTNNPAFSFPERHLGLVPFDELSGANERLDAAADALAQTSLGQFSWSDWQRWAVDFLPHEKKIVPELLKGFKLGIAKDFALSFIYQANLDCLLGLGVEPKFFSVLTDQQLPECDAVWLPGGYPELYAKQLSENTGIKNALIAHVNTGKTLWAECGGMMPLFDSLIDKHANRYAMWGLLQGEVHMQTRVTAIGPYEWRVGADTLRGHSFHFSTCVTSIVPSSCAYRPGVSHGKGEPIYVLDGLLATYFHAWFSSAPELVAHIFRHGPLNALSASH